ncbi:PREDICTED: nucleoplasmin-like protein [Rhagoletis zephyria]|uniref:nucleoplasmin-like protein n=1 Tax=Rhagoletis zephyria TaxID=28612 RepID=UPI0008116C67|nr:PREDICTED: nucleoplasmin-like protein [Rhagoletis zephyria]XP_036324683.1 nucleoplasmin-like protein [Rhagoletis pomonella]
MEREEFYGVTLSEKEPLAQFEMEEPHTTAEDQKLVIKQICLGAEAKEGEFNVVQVVTRINQKETLKIPIAVLKAGETRALRPNVEFLNTSVTFKLIQGTGPVHMYGQNLYGQISGEEGGEPAWYENEEMDEDDVDDDEYDDEASPPPQTNGKNSNKRK